MVGDRIFFNTHFTEDAMGGRDDMIDFAFLSAMPDDLRPLSRPDNALFRARVSVSFRVSRKRHWNVLYSTAPAPILQPVCSVTLNIADDQGNILKTNTFSQFTAGKGVALDLNADTDLTGNTH
jgi:hypothetical protein